MDWLYYYQLLSPLMFGAALRCWASYAIRGHWTFFVLGILSASAAFHGMFLLYRNLIEGPNYFAVPFLAVTLVLVYGIIAMRLYRSFGSIKSGDTSSN